MGFQKLMYETILEEVKKKKKSFILYYYMIKYKYRYEYGYLFHQYGKQSHCFVYYFSLPYI